MPEYGARGTVCVVIDAEAAIEMGIRFLVTRANAVITRAPIDPDLIVYILDNKMIDPMENTLYTHPAWDIGDIDFEDSTQQQGGTQAQEHANSSSGSVAYDEPAGA